MKRMTREFEENAIIYVNTFIRWNQERNDYWMRKEWNRSIWLPSFQGWTSQWGIGIKLSKHSKTNTKIVEESSAKISYQKYFFWSKERIIRNGFLLVAIKIKFKSISISLAAVNMNVWNESKWDRKHWQNSKSLSK